MSPLSWDFTGVWAPPANQIMLIQPGVYPHC